MTITQLLNNQKRYGKIIDYAKNMIKDELVNMIDSVSLINDDIEMSEASLIAKEDIFLRLHKTYPDVKEAYFYHDLVEEINEEISKILGSYIQ